MTLWCIFRSPLIAGTNLTQLDKFAASLLTNEEVLAVDQHSASSRPVINEAKRAIWVAKSDNGGATYLALFNLADGAQTLEYPLQALGLSGTAFTVRDVWLKKDLGSSDRIKVTLASHASALYRLGKTP